jgi:signal peptidase I
MTRTEIVKDIIVPIMVGLAIFFLFRALIEPFVVEHSSMWPTIEEGEYILVDKVSYHLHQPQRGDIIVFRPPWNVGRPYIKRIIGLPGDTVEIKDGAVFVNGSRLDEPYAGRTQDILFPTKIPEGEYFVLGDNRNNSYDSRRGWTVSRDYIVGKAWITYWPPKKWRLIKHADLRAEKNFVISLFIGEALCLRK